MRKCWIIWLALAVSAPVCAQQAPGMDTVVVESGSTTTDEEGSVTGDSDEDEPPKNYLLPVRPEDRAPVAARTVPASRLDSMRRSEDYWYWNQKKKEERDDGKSWLAALFGSGVLRYVFWTLIAIGCAALLYFFLLSLNVNPFAPRSKEGGEEGEAADAEADFFSRDYDAEVARALASGDYRLAIRARYLQLLRDMAERNIIQYRHERPNGVYVSQLLGTDYFKAFFRVTRTFEYAWYGEMAVTRAAFDYMQQDIDQLKSRFA